MMITIEQHMPTYYNISTLIAINYCLLSRNVFVPIMCFYITQFCIVEFVTAIMAWSSCQTASFYLMEAILFNWKYLRIDAASLQ